jgi:exopolysaccharide production protein ExoQ
MPRIHPSKRSVPRQSPSSVSRNISPVFNHVKGHGAMVILSILFWLIFYLNMPDNLEGFAAKAEEGATTANVLARNFKIGMIAMSLYFISTRWSLMRSLGRNLNPGLVAFLVLVPLSAAWSIEPSATILRFISLLSVVLVCFAVSVAGWHRRRFQQVVIPPVMFILLASLVVGIVLPDKIAEIGTDISQRDAWHGITHGKNEFGMVASFGVILCVNTWLAREGRMNWAIAGAAAAFACLILSRSNTSLLATVVSLFTMVLVMRVPVIRRRYSTHVIVATAAIILLYELVIQNVLPGVNTLLAPIMSLTGKDATFSARTIIWKVIKEHIELRPYLGTGYGAYWIGPDPRSPSYIFTSLMFFYPMEAHNGYLEIINDLGLLGLVCLLAFLFFFIRQALRLMPFDRNQASLYVALLFQEMIINMSESDWLSRTNTFSVFLLAVICLSRGLVGVGSPNRAVSSVGK